MSYRTRRLAIRISANSTASTGGSSGSTGSTGGSSGSSGTSSNFSSGVGDSTGGVHAYFDRLRALPECIASYSLRGSTQLNSLAITSPSTWWTYGYASDTYALKQDAAKLTWANNRVSVQNYLQMPLPQYTSGTILIIWDHWIGPEWRFTTDGGQMSTRMQTIGLNHKAYNLLTSSGSGSGAATWQPNVTYAPVSTGTDLGTYSVRPINASAGINGITVASPLAPAGLNSTSTYPVKHSKWSRHILQVDLNIDSSTGFDDWTAAISTSTSITPDVYHRFTQWFMDETRGPVRNAFRVPSDVTYPTPAGIDRPAVSEFWAEWNTSAHMPWSSGAIRLTGVEGTSIPQGLIVIRDSDGIRYQTTSSGTISGGVAEVNAQALQGDEKGPEGNCSSGTEMHLSTTLANIDSTVRTSRPMVDGAFMMGVNGVMYARNVVVLRNYNVSVFNSSSPESDTNIFERPIGST